MVVRPVMEASGHSAVPATRKRRLLMIILAVVTGVFMISLGTWLQRGGMDTQPQTGESQSVSVSVIPEIDTSAMTVPVARVIRVSRHFHDPDG